MPRSVATAARKGPAMLGEASRHSHEHKHAIGIKNGQVDRSSYRWRRPRPSAVGRLMATRCHQGVWRRPRDLEGDPGKEKGRFCTWTEARMCLPTRLAGVGWCRGRGSVGGSGDCAAVLERAQGRLEVLPGVRGRRMRCRTEFWAARRSWGRRRCEGWSGGLLEFMSTSGDVRGSLRRCFLALRRFGKPRRVAGRGCVEVSSHLMA